MKKILVILFFLPLFALAQKKEIKHTVGPKESLTSIGRTYNINGRALAEYNHLDYEKGLSIGQVLKIPVSAETNVPKNVPVGTSTPVNENGNPIYHKVVQGEGLYGISRNYNVSIDQIKKWNNLSTDAIELNQQLIVGFSASNSATPAKEKTEQPIVKKVEETVVSEQTVPSKKEAIKTVAPAKKTKYGSRQ